MECSATAETAATYTEQDPATAVLTDTVIDTVQSYGGGYIEFALGSSASSETLGLQRVATANTTASATAQPASGEVSAQFLVEGMTCSHCVRSVTEEVSAIDGVSDVAVDLHAGGVSTVTVSSATPVDAERVRAAVEEAGYSLAAAS